MYAINGDTAGLNYLKNFAKSLSELGSQRGWNIDFNDFIKSIDQSLKNIAANSPVLMNASGTDTTVNAPERNLSAERNSAAAANADKAVQAAREQERIIFTLLREASKERDELDEKIAKKLDAAKKEFNEALEKADKNEADKKEIENRRAEIAVLEALQFASNLYSAAEDAGSTDLGKSIRAEAEKLLKLFPEMFKKIQPEIYASILPDHNAAQEAVNELLSSFPEISEKTEPESLNNASAAILTNFKAVQDAVNELLKPLPKETLKEIQPQLNDIYAGILTNSITAQDAVNALLKLLPKETLKEIQPELKAISGNILTDFKAVQDAVNELSDLLPEKIQPELLNAVSAAILTNSNTAQAEKIVTEFNVPSIFWEKAMYMDTVMLPKEVFAIAFRLMIALEQIEGKLSAGQQRMKEALEEMIATPYYELLSAKLTLEEYQQQNKINFLEVNLETLVKEGNVPELVRKLDAVKTMLNNDNIEGILGMDNLPKQIKDLLAEMLPAKLAKMPLEDLEALSSSISDGDLQGIVDKVIAEAKEKKVNEMLESGDIQGILGMGNLSEQVKNNLVLKLADMEPEQLEALTISDDGLKGIVAQLIKDKIEEKAQRQEMLGIQPADTGDVSKTTPS